MAYIDQKDISDEFWNQEQVGNGFPHAYWHRCANCKGSMLGESMVNFYCLKCREEVFKPVV